MMNEAQKQRAELTALKEDIGDLSKKLLYEVTRPIKKDDVIDKANKRWEIKNLKNRLKEKIGIFGLLKETEIIINGTVDIKIYTSGGLVDKVLIDGEEQDFNVRDKG